MTAPRPQTRQALRVCQELRAETGGHPRRYRCRYLIDEYRLITFPTVLGQGDRLLANGVPADFRFTVAEPAGAAGLTVLAVLRRHREDR